MIKTKHKIFSVVLCVTLVLCTFFALSVSVSAASGDTVYVRIPSSWTTAYCYMWTDDVGNNKAWPGVQMTATSESGVYSYTLTGDFAKIIFNNGNSGVGTNQTSDMAYSNYNGYICDLTSNISTGSWSVYGGDVTNPTTPTTPTTPSGDGTTVFLKNTANWTQPRCYMWNSETDKDSSWPGANMTKVEGDVWVYTASKTFANCIFNPGGDDGKTADLKNIKSGQIYDYSTGTWSDYDLSPLQIKSYSADPGSSIYTGVEVTLSATAVSSEGTVSYKFSANGTTVRDWAAGNTATWTPTTAGNYTLTFDVKDSAGNENSRTLSVTVESDANVTSPIIKKVTPSDNGYVKTGTAKINVTAAGGHTGTNLLFYKYEIKDPNGASNTAYYTLSPEYSYQFNTEGDYKVTVHVQASDNSEATKTFTVKATGGDIPTEPTTQQIVTQPTTSPITEYELGDVNKDGVIDIKDATYLQLFLIEKDGYTVTKELGDFNKDGKLNVSDVTAIRRFIAERG